MRKTTFVLIATLIPAAAVTGCRDKEEAPVETVATEAERLQEEAQREAARRAEEAAALEGRLAALKDSVAKMKSGLGAGPSPVELDEAIRGLEADLDSASRALADLRGAEGDAWNGARERLAGLLDGLEAQSTSAAASVAGWSERLAATREARTPLEIPLAPKGGLILGLDGGQYDPYLVSVIESVQKRLRAKGLYAGDADGYFDVTTREAVGRFQEGEGLAVSGVPSPMTRARLFAD